MTNTTELEKATILVVDDQPENVDVLIVHLGKFESTILVALNGQEALEIAQEYTPDIILLDVVMPHMDGFETCRRLKENETTKEIPIIFLSALAETAAKVTGFEAGAVDYITKPFEQAEVLARVAAHLTIRTLQKELQGKNAQLEEKNTQLQEALGNIKTLKGFIPICANCKKIRDDKGFWNQVEVYVRDHTEAEFSHGICPDCARELYPEFYEKL